MRITLFRDLKEENWPSMERYATALLSAMRNDQFSIFNFQLTDFVVPRQDLTPSKSLNLYYTRYFYYPLKARGQQGDVNHIVDHSYGHLVYALDPKRTVVTCHDLNPLKHEESWLNRWLFKFSLGGLKRAARIISDSEATKKDLIKFLEITPDKIKVIPLGVEEKFRVIDNQGELDRVRRKFNIPHDRKVLMHVGGSAYNKNIEGVLRALSALTRKQFIDSPKANRRLRINSTFQQLSFVKIGSDFTEIQKGLIRELDIEDRVKYLGQVSEEDLIALYNIADVFVFPSFYEGFGLPVLEAMACGTPVVTAKLSSLPKVVGEAAILVDPYNSTEIALAISKVLHYDTAQYHSLVQKGLERAKRFSWQKTAEETLKVYEEVSSNFQFSIFQLSNKLSI